MPLNVKRAGAEEYGSTMKVLLAGEPGAGKTRLSSTFPNVFYANIEGGLMSVADRGCPHVDVTSSADMAELLQILRTSPRTREQALGVQVDTVVVDTLDSYQKLLIEERKTNERKESMAQADWGWLGDQLRMIVRHYRNLPLNVVFTCHLKSDKDEETGQTFQRLALQGAMCDEMPAYVDLAVLLKAQPVPRNVDGKVVRVLQRTLQTGPDTHTAWLKDRSGKLPLEFEVDLTTDYARLRTAIFGAPVPASVNLGVATTDVAGAGQLPPKQAETKQAEAEPKKESRAEKAVKPAAKPEAQAQSVAVAEGDSVTNQDGEVLWTWVADKKLLQFATNVVDAIDWKARRLYLSMDQWKATARHDVERLEVLDQGKSQTWAVALRFASHYGQEAEAGYGIPLEAFDVVDATGWVVTAKSLADPEPDAHVAAPPPEVAPVGRTLQPHAAQADPPVEPAPVAPAAPIAPAAVAPAVASPATTNGVEASAAEASRPPCEVCGGPIETDDLLDLSKLRFHQALCKKDFTEANVAKKAKKGTK